MHWKRYSKWITILYISNAITPLHYSDVIIGEMASQIPSITIVYSTVFSGADQRKHQTPRHWRLWGDFTDDWWISRTNGQERGKYFHLWRHHGTTTNVPQQHWCGTLVELHWCGTVFISSKLSASAAYVFPPLRCSVNINIYQASHVIPLLDDGSSALKQTKVRILLGRCPSGLVSWSNRLEVVALSLYEATVNIYESNTEQITLCRLSSRYNTTHVIYVFRMNIYTRVRVQNIKYSPVPF